MSDQSHHPDDDMQLQLPAGLVEELKSLYEGPPAVPPGRSELILSSARAQFAGRRRMKLAMRIGGAVAAAAAIALVVVMVLPQRPAPIQQTQGPVASQPAATDRRDLNTDGAVNILDAYLLAKQVEREQAMDRSLDFNLDGRVNRADADALASAVVSLREGGAVR